MREPSTVTPELARHVVGRVFEEAWNVGQVDVLAEILSADFTGHGADGETFDAGVLASRVRDRRLTLPDLHYDVLRYVVELPWVATMWAGHGRPAGEQAVEAVSLGGLTLWRLDGRRVREAWVLGFEGRRGWEPPRD